MYTPNASPNARRPNATYIPLTHVGVVTQILGIAMGVTQILGFLVTNMLVSLTQNCGVRGSKAKPGPNVNGFASQWNIAFNLHEMSQM